MTLTKKNDSNATLTEGATAEGATLNGVAFGGGNPHGGNPSKGAGEAENLARQKKSKTTVKPDETAFKEALEAHYKVIDDLRAKVQALKSKISEASSGKDEYMRQRAELRQSLDGLQERIDKMEAERKQVSELIEKAQNDTKAKRQTANKLKQSLNVASPDDINERIKGIEATMMISTMSLKDEKKLMQEISQLKASRNRIGKLTAVAGADTPHDNEAQSLGPLKVKLEMLTEALREARKNKRLETERFKKLVADRQAAVEPLKALFAEKEKYNKQLEQQQAKKRELYLQHSSEMHEYYTFQKQQRFARFEKIKQEKAKRAMEQQKQSLARQLEMMDDLPYEAELLLREQTIKYVMKMIEERDNRVNATSGNLVESNILSDALIGEGQALLPKNQRKQDDTVINKKAHHKKMSAKRLGKPHAFKHDIGTLSYFEQCGVKAPVTDDDLDECLSQLQQKYQEFKSLQEEEAGKHIQKRNEIEEQLRVLDPETGGSDVRPDSAVTRNANWTDKTETTEDKPLGLSPIQNAESVPVGA